MTRDGLCAVCRSVICCNRFLPRGGPMMLSTSVRPLSRGRPRSRFSTCRAPVVSLEVADAVAGTLALYG